VLADCQCQNGVDFFYFIIMATPIKPLVLVCSTPVSGHFIPMRTIAKHLVARGYDVCFVSGSGYRQQIEAIGASFIPVEGYGDFHDLRARDLDPRCMRFSLFYCPF
jgi:UDP:flavonoid glycosyltransferase YjiC (YdhE family)